MQKDLVTADEVSVAECYNFTDTTGVIIQGWTTDPTRYIRVYAPAGQRHNGTAGTGYRIIPSSARAIQIREGHVRLEGIEFRASGDYTGVYADSSDSLPASPYILVKDCLIYNCGSVAGTYHGIYAGRCGASGYPMFVINTIIYGCKGDGIRADSGYAAAIIDVLNCTVNNNGGYGVRKNSNSAVVQVKNCYAGANATADYSSSDSTWTAFTTNASSDTTGTSGLQNIAHSTSSGAYFTNVTAGSEDYHIGGSSALKDVGTDLSATFTTDIDGATRSGTWDIGADEITAGGTTYNESVTLGMGAGHTYSGGLAMYPSIMLSMSSSVSPAGGLNLSEALTLAASMGITETATLTMIESLVLAVNSALTNTGTITMAEAITLSVSQAFSASYFELDPRTASKVLHEAARVLKAVADNRIPHALHEQNTGSKAVKH
jgi:hypothetical protein